MKHVFTKATVVLTLIIAFSFLISGTASAHNTTSAQFHSPLCGYTQKSNWETSYGVNIIKWENTCTGAYHCEAIDDNYLGPFTVELDVYNSSGVLKHYSDWSTPLFTLSSPPGNTHTIAGGYSRYTCNAYESAIA